MQCFDTNWEKMQCLLISHLHSAWVTRFSSLKETSLVCILFHAISPGIGGGGGGGEGGSKEREFLCPNILSVSPKSEQKFLREGLQV